MRSSDRDDLDVLGQQLRQANARRTHLHDPRIAGLADAHRAPMSHTHGIEHVAVVALKIRAVEPGLVTDPKLGQADTRRLGGTCR